MSSLINSIGVMQGRLLPKYRGRYQAHPVNYWSEEFSIAKEIGFEYIEFILDFNECELNPLLSDTGLEMLQKLIQSIGTGVKSVCADYFMEAPMHHADPQVATASVEMMTRLISNCGKMGIKDIVLPCVDQSSLSDVDSRNRFVKQLIPLQDIAARHNVNISLETDLPPTVFAELLDNFPSPYVTVNYDTGNSASLGYKVTEEFESYGDRISDIHIKDRKLHGGSVFLGTGDTDFNSFLSVLPSISYSGPFIFQVFRDDEGVEICKQQLNWFLNKVNNF